MRMRSSMVTVAPMPPSSSTVVVTSFRWGTLPTTTGPSASSAPARMGSVAFLAPEMRTSPSRGVPPWICSLSMSLPPGFGWRQRLDRERMDLAAHALAEGLVDQLVAGDAALAGKLPATMRAWKWVSSSDCTRTSAPGRPARISRAISSGIHDALPW